MYARFGAAALALALVPASVLAQQNPLEGTWYGLMKEYRYGEPRRNLTVSFIGGTPSCIWQEIGKATDPERCTIEANNISLTTGAGSTVTVALANGQLDGTFTLKNGKSFALSMARKPIDNATLQSLMPGVPVGKPLKVCRGLLAQVGKGMANVRNTAIWLEIRQSTIGMWYRTEAVAVPSSKAELTLLGQLPLTVEGETLKFRNPYTGSAYTLQPIAEGYRVTFSNLDVTMAGNAACP